MVVLRMRGNGKVQERNKDKNRKASLSKVAQMGPKKWVVNSTACSNMLRCLKGLALDPCEPKTLKDLVGKLRNQTLKLRKVWRSDDGECSQVSSQLNLFLLLMIICFPNNCCIQFNFVFSNVIFVALAYISLKLVTGSSLNLEV